jgi:hypothetical protein
MRNRTCIICSNEFAPREGKLYCSNACKQKGHTDKKHEATEIANMQREQEEKKAGKKFVIYFTEYQEYNKKYPDTFLKEFTLYCFFRKNWTGTFDKEKFRQYVNSFDDVWWDEFWDVNGTYKVSAARKKYNEFQEKFFGGDEFIVSFEETK